MSLPLLDAEWARACLGDRARRARSTCSLLDEIGLHDPAGGFTALCGCEGAGPMAALATALTNPAAAVWKTTAVHGASSSPMAATPLDDWQVCRRRRALSVPPTPPTASRRCRRPSGRTPAICEGGYL